MQSVVVDPTCTGALLFVRAEPDVEKAVRAVNQLLASRARPDSPATDILGIIVRRNVDADIGDRFAVGPTAGEVAYRASASLCGIWSLCWFDFEPWDDGDPRRERLLSRLTAADLGQLIPVWTPDEARRDLSSLRRALERQHPHLGLHPEAYVHEPPPRGLIRVPEI